MITPDQLAKVMNFTVEQGIYGPKFVLRGWWRDQAETFMREQDIRELDLNYAKNWPVESVEFLYKLDFLVNLQIISHKENFGPVGTLVHLRALRIDALSTEVVDFDLLNALEQCYVEWHRNVAGVLNCASLRDLYLQSFGEAGCSKLSGLTNLEKLAIGNGSVSSLVGLEHLTKLRHVGLYNLRKLTSVAILESTPALRDLEISGCRKIQAIAAEVGNMVNLESLRLESCGEIATLAPLVQLKNLRKLYVGENTTIGDGDVSVFLELPELTEFRFQKRRSYTHTPAEVAELLAAKNAKKSP